MSRALVALKQNSVIPTEVAQSATQRRDLLLNLPFVLARHSEAQPKNPSAVRTLTTTRKLLLKIQISPVQKNSVIPTEVAQSATQRRDLLLNLPFVLARHSEAQPKNPSAVRTLTTTRKLLLKIQISPVQKKLRRPDRSRAKRNAAEGP